MAERCAVIGVGQTHHKAKRDDVSIAGLVREAAKMALADADLTWTDIDAVVIGKAPDMFEGNMMPEIYLAPALGAVGKPMIRVHTAGSVGGSTGVPVCGSVRSSPPTHSPALPVVQASKLAPFSLHCFVPSPRSAQRQKTFAPGVQRTPPGVASVVAEQPCVEAKIAIAATAAPRTARTFMTAPQDPFDAAHAAPPQAHRVP